MSELPSVAVVIPNWNGAAHLPDCLDSLAALDYPRDRVEVIVADNGSTDSSVRLLEGRYPWVRVISQSENVGFAAASNAGARAASTSLVAFLNNDMRVDPRWLSELVAMYDPSAGYVCVAGAILNWEGTHIDFVDGRINFHGAPNAEHVDLPVDEVLIEDGRDLAFPCGGSMLIGRDVFLETGGFDPEYFAYCEDVDLGWRLWVTGHKVRLAARSRCFHRGQGTSSALPPHQRQILYERNTLLTLIKNVGDGNLAPLLAAALFLLVERSLIVGGSDRSAFAAGSDASENELVSRMGMAPLHAASEVLGDLENVLARRREIQQRRKRSDAEVFALFRRPFAPVVESEDYLRASINLRAVLDLDQLFRRQRASRVLVVARSNSERLRGIARSVSALTQVVLASTVRTPTLPGVSVTPIRDDEYLDQLLTESDVVIVDGETDRASVIADRTPGVLAVDLPGAASVDPRLLERADVFLCTSGEEAAAVQAGSSGARPVIVVSDGGHDTLAQLRSIIQEPWLWRRRQNGAGEIVLPEDLQLLLATRRARSGGEGAARRVPRAVWSRLPEGVQRAVLRFAVRPRARRK